MTRPLTFIVFLLLLITADAAAGPGNFRGGVHPMVRVWLSSHVLRKQAEPIAPAKVQAPVSIRFRSPPSFGVQTGNSARCERGATFGKQIPIQGQSTDPIQESYWLPLASAN